jgi:hypothetical protein
VITFNTAIHSKHKWSCGCAEKYTQLFPGLSFLDDTTWAKTGVTDLKHLDEKVKKARRFSKTLKNVTDLAMLETLNTVSQLSKTY